MRLREEEIRIIRDEVARVFGPEARVRLFGSRTDDRRRGGDIDLYIEASGDERTRLEREGHLLYALLTRLGDQRIDIVTAPPGGKGRAIDEVALGEGIALGREGR